MTPATNKTRPGWMKRALLRPQFCKRAGGAAARALSDDSGGGGLISWVAMNLCRLTLTPLQTPSTFPEQPLGTPNPSGARCLPKLPDKDLKGRLGGATNRNCPFNYSP
ncbi:MAG: hypothetical protein CM15mP103_12460 [Gammaproteobacteria bacterium]|nr:MAG: hypothetical protein CM15mP103_12460 [Gammaproteobacteria bacterium]